MPSAKHNLAVDKALFFIVPCHFILRCAFLLAMEAAVLSTCSATFVHFSVLLNSRI